MLDPEDRSLDQESRSRIQDLQDPRMLIMDPGSCIQDPQVWERWLWCLDGAADSAKRTAPGTSYRIYDKLHNMNKLEIYIIWSCLCFCSYLWPPLRALRRQICQKQYFFDKIYTCLRILPILSYSLYVAPGATHLAESAAPVYSLYSSLHGARGLCRGIVQDRSQLVTKVLRIISNTSLATRLLMHIGDGKAANIRKT